MSSDRLAEWYRNGEQLAASEIRRGGIVHAVEVHCRVNATVGDETLSECDKATAIGESDALLLAVSA